MLPLFDPSTFLRALRARNVWQDQRGSSAVSKRLTVFTYIRMLENCVSLTTTDRAIRLRRLLQLGGAVRISPAQAASRVRCHGVSDDAIGAARGKEV